MMKQNQTIERLKLFYLLAFVLGAIIIAPTHIFPQPYFMYARFPHYLEIMGSFLGITWPATFEIYHYVLYVLTIILSFNAVGILIYPKFRKITIFSSIVGIIAFSLMILFFFFKFIAIDVPSSVVLGIYSIIWLILNLSTFKAFLAR